MEVAFAKTAKEVYSVILKDLSAYGGGPFYGIAIVAAALMGDLPFAYMLALSLVAATVAVALIRLAYFKPRPGQKKRRYSTVYERVDNSSFPSIHAARALMISMAFVSKMPAFLPLALLLIAVVCLSRLHFRRHDTKDVFVGLLLGFILGVIFF